MENLLSSSKVLLKKKAPTILTCAGGMGVVATTVMAVKATPKALTLLEQAEAEKGEDLTKLEKVKIAGPAYIPTIAMGASTLACIFGANALNKRNQAALTSAYAFVDRSYKEYRAKVKELYGEEGDERVEEEIAKDKYEETKVIVKEDEQLFYDVFSRRYFVSTPYKVQYAKYELNRDIVERGAASVNDFYYYLNLEPIDGGDELGWSAGMNLDYYWQTWLDFEHSVHTLDDGVEYTTVDFFSEPLVDYEYY